MYWKFERYIVVFVLLLLLSLQLSKAQDSLKVESTETKIVHVDSLAQDTASIVVLKHSPTKAALLSAVFPGLGQIYNKKYWKLPIVYAGIAVSAYFLINNQRNYNLYYEGLVNYSNNSGNSNRFAYVQDLYYIKTDPYAKASNPDRVNQVLNFYVDLYRRYRDWSFVALAGTYVLGIIDAAVDAYLFDYDISDNLALKARPSIINTINGGNTFGLKVCLSLH